MERKRERAENKCVYLLLLYFCLCNFGNALCVKRYLRALIRNFELYVTSSCADYIRG